MINSNKNDLIESLTVRKDYRSPNFDDRAIVVEFVVIHYTACTLVKTLEIFTNQARQVSAHLVIDLDGTVYELVPCLQDKCLRAWHAGKSTYTDLSGSQWNGFNDFSIGIELVNLNGNLYDYTDQQYQSLVTVIKQLGKHHAHILNPERIIGHEQIAGYRGKSDPGACFDWNRLYSLVFADSSALLEYSIPERTNRLPDTLIQALHQLARFKPEDREAQDLFFTTLSQLIEILSIKALS